LRTNASVSNEHTCDRTRAIATLCRQPNATATHYPTRPELRGQGPPRHCINDLLCPESWAHRCKGRVQRKAQDRRAVGRARRAGDDNWHRHLRRRRPQSAMTPVTTVAWAGRPAGSGTSVTESCQVRWDPGGCIPSPALSAPSSRPAPWPRPSPGSSPPSSHSPHAACPLAAVRCGCSRARDLALAGTGCCRKRKTGECPAPSDRRQGG
jgi:hypothetical protein